MLKLERLVTIDLSCNGIGQRGASAIYEALATIPASSRLTSLRLDDNPAIAPQMQAAIATQLLLNNLEMVVNETRDMPPSVPARPDSAEEFGVGATANRMRVGRAAASDDLCLRAACPAALDDLSACGALPCCLR